MLTVSVEMHKGRWMDSGRWLCTSTMDCIMQSPKKTHMMVERTYWHIYKAPVVCMTKWTPKGMLASLYICMKYVWGSLEKSAIPLSMLKTYVDGRRKRLHNSYIYKKFDIYFLHLFFR
jgi:hypothetical protein